MSDPLTALMHAVQVMNLLKTLITKTLRERDEADEDASDGYSTSTSPSSCYEEELDCQHDCRTTHFREKAEFLSEIEDCFLQHLNEVPKDMITSESLSIMSSSSANSTGSATSFMATDTTTEC